jgi:site-specific DNA-methyltransferase (adenine-specific)
MIEKILLGDCFDILPNIPDSSVDMILCDMPYGTTECKWDSLLDLNLLWAHYKRIVKSRCAVVLFSSQPFTTTLINSNMSWFKYVWIWEKSRPTDIFNAKNKPLKSHEDICVFSDGTVANGSTRKMRYYPQGLEEANIPVKIADRSTQYCGKRPSRLPGKIHIVQKTNYPRDILKFESEKNTIHPTQKPVRLLEFLIKTYTKEGDIVLDNCIGSGTTAIAAINTNRHFIGIEKDLNYFNLATNRIKNHLDNLSESCKGIDQVNGNTQLSLF